MQQADACQEISEMNHVAALLRRHGYTFGDRGVWLVVDDPVHSLLGGQGGAHWDATSRDSQPPTGSQIHRRALLNHLNGPIHGANFSTRMGTRSPNRGQCLSPLSE